MDEIDLMESWGMPVTRLAGARIWDSLDFLAMLRQRKWKQNVRGHDSSRSRHPLRECEICGLRDKRQLERHHPWEKLKPNDSRRGLVVVLCKKCHVPANRRVA